MSIRRRRDRNLKELRKQQHLVTASGQAYQSENSRQTTINKQGNWQYQPQMSNNKRAVYFDREKNEYVVGLRGTVISDPEDLQDDLAIVKNSLVNRPRFKREKLFLEQLKKRHNPSRITLTGHSLGGALATQLAQKTGDHAVGYNSGTAPTVGNFVGNTVRRFKNGSKVKTYNVSSDPISLTNPWSKRINRKRGLDPHSLNNFVIEGGKMLKGKFAERKLSEFNFSTPVLRVVKDLELKNQGSQIPVELLGSQSRKILSLYASDYDFFQQLTMSDIPLFVDHVINLIRGLGAEPNVQIVELKVQGWPMKKIKPSISNLQRYKKQIEFGVASDPFTKLDLVLFDGKYYNQITIVYLFAPIAKPKQIISELKRDAIEYKKAGYRYKSAKRLLQSGTVNQRKKAWLVVTDPILSTTNLAISRLEGYLQASKPDNKSLTWIKQDLSKVLTGVQQQYLVKLLRPPSKARVRQAIQYLHKQKLT